MTESFFMYLAWLTTDVGIVAFVLTAGFSARLWYDLRTRLANKK